MCALWVWSVECNVDWSIFVIAAMVSLLGVNVDFWTLKGAGIALAGWIGPDARDACFSCPKKA
jgi:hypothetical protein